MEESLQGVERGFDTLNQIFGKVISVNRNDGDGRSRRTQFRGPPAALAVFQIPPKIPL
jgi:hypothetical protein